MITIKSALQSGESALEGKSTTAKLDAEVLLGFVIKKSRTYLYTHPQSTISDADDKKFKSLIDKRATGYPVAYILGVQEFWSLPFLVNEHTLIPRPDTELLVEKTLELLPNSPTNVLELGTGSGAIAIALAKERVEWRLDAVDIDQGALKVAQKNAVIIGVENINFIESCWFVDIDKKYAAIVSNPPYIAESDPHLADVKYEPNRALTSGIDGLDAITYISKHARDYLQDSGLILFEHGYNQGAEVRRILQDYGYDEVNTWQDLQDHDRITSAVYT